MENQGKQNVRYDHTSIEKKWQERWEKEGIYKTGNDQSKPKHYVLDMFPYPSGDGLHVGHVKVYTASDVFARFKRMSGYNVLHPMGWDAFGLPAEQYALKNKTHPSIITKSAIDTFRGQMQRLGFSYDWNREFSTTDPEFYKWTQWIFLQIFNRGLAFESHEPINWCPSCMTGLANEDLDGGNCERCGSVVEKRPLRQWVLRITDYADRLLDDLDLLDWPQAFKDLQRNWIGKSEGAELDFKISNSDSTLTVFTTRPDTLFGVTFVAVSANKAIELSLKGENISPEAISFATALKDEEATRGFVNINELPKRGIDTGLRAIHPITGKVVPVWIANYVLSDYGTGVVMAVPAHDSRDLAFAQAYDLPVIEVITSAEGVGYEGDGALVNSGEFDGRDNREAVADIVRAANGRIAKQYRLKDWVFARQRYWGEPIPLVFKDGKAYPVDEADLPVLLPDVAAYEPTGTGESPLAGISDWVNVKGYLTNHGTFRLIADGQNAPEGVKVEDFRRETNTMPQWAGSSWYYLRYIDPKNDMSFVDKDLERYWSPVDMYVGGAEHATRHLIYARFWHKVLFDIGAVAHAEPFTKLKGVGLVLAADGRKMSKRYGNVINPDDVARELGADTLRMGEMFMGPFDQSFAWSVDTIAGVRRFIERVWRMHEKVGEAAMDADTEFIMHSTIKKVGADIEAFKFNTAIAQLMTYVNALEKLPVVPVDAYRNLLRLMAPLAPHVADELWTMLGSAESIHHEAWPKFIESKTERNTVMIAVQVNGKLRDTFEVARGTDNSEVEKIALSRDAVQKWITGAVPKKVIVISDKMVSVVV
jgi:leucyl-tRNA synthetase